MKLIKCWKVEDEYTETSDSYLISTFENSEGEQGYFMTKQQLREFIERAYKLSASGNAQASVVEKILKGIE